MHSEQAAPDLLQKSLDASGVGWWQLDFGQREMTCSRLAADLFGADRTRISFEEVYLLPGEEHRARIYTRCAALKVSDSLDETFVTANGDRCLQVRAVAAANDPLTGVRSVFGTVRRVTEGTPENAELASINQSYKATQRNYNHLAQLIEHSLNGALARKIAAQKDALTALQAHLAAWVDFPEEDVPELSQSHLCDVLGGVEQELDALIQSYDAGAVLREGVDCAIVGKPNAGKSTLLNLLAGFDRAIVTPVAGTTRDVVEQAVQLGDVRLNLFDTAGLRQTEDEIEAEGIRRSWKKLDEAGLILAVFDGSERPTREDLELAQRCAGRPAIALVNKEDKPTRFDAELIAPYFAMVLPVCCQEEGARKVIAAAVARLLGTSQIDPHAASLSGQRQLSAATRARDAVAGALDAAQGLGLDAVSVCVDDALDALCELTGENASEAVINEVFEKFCVGK